MNIPKLINQRLEEMGKSSTNPTQLQEAHNDEAVASVDASNIASSSLIDPVPSLQFKLGSSGRNSTEELVQPEEVTTIQKSKKGQYVFRSLSLFENRDIKPVYDRPSSVTKYTTRRAKLLRSQTLPP
jgi:hypothetical protein